MIPSLESQILSNLPENTGTYGKRKMSFGLLSVRAQHLESLYPPLTYCVLLSPTRARRSSVARVRRGRSPAGSPALSAILVCTKSQESGIQIKQGWKMERGQEEGRHGKCKLCEQESGTGSMWNQDKAAVGLAECPSPTWPAGQKVGPLLKLPLSLLHN